MTPTQHAATVREWLKKLPTNGIPLAALDALQAQAETALEAEYARGYEQGIQLLAAAEAERDRLAARVEQLASIMNPPYDEYEKLAARIEELEAALTNLRDRANLHGVWWLENECRAALNKETA